ncbi:MAG: glycosyltransferase, partial [Chloroflexi bacterium]|nr:glycosyltransferase [Chloroflexota bacterium]
MAERLDLVVLYAPPWDGPAQFSKHHLARNLAARGHRVLYVEAPLGPLSLARRRMSAASELRGTRAPPRPVMDRLWVRRYFNPVPYHAVTRVTSTRTANRIGQRLLAPGIRRDLARLGFRRPVIVAGLPHAVDALPRLPRRALAYHCADDYAHVRGFPASLPALERDLCRQADLVIVTAETLRGPRAAYNPNTYWVPNGVDTAHFSAPARPAEELRMLRRPVLGFVGGLAQWVDVGLLAEIGGARPDASVVLVGPISTDVGPLAGLPNVHLLGPRPYADVPRYLAAMDVALIPFVSDAVTYHADPIKAYEYLAAGVPVVATDVPALRRLRPQVRVADSRARFLIE